MRFHDKAHRFVFLLIIFCLMLGGAGYLYTHYYQSKSPHSQAASIDEPLHPNQDSAEAQQIYQDSLKPDYTIPPIVNGLAPVISRLPTKEPVVFLGIDDGANKQDFELQTIKDNHVKASLFLANRFIKNNPDFFKGFVSAGSIIENHTINHKLLSHLSYDEQKAEVCGEADLQEKQFGRRPILFRPPGGSYNKDTRRAAADCGMKAVVMWIAKANGGSMQYQIGNKLRPGDIVLMHFRPEFQKDMQAFLDAQKAAGLHTELLENWLPASKG
ncbi:MAG: polysaccharide deacetylase [Candidatus Saccharibacteria bacterium]|nr:polysaccharide deacetylase [Candidatus Saccharibacteria bacterium]